MADTKGVPAVGTMASATSLRVVGQGTWMVSMDYRLRVVAHVVKALRSATEMTEMVEANACLWAVMELLWLAVKRGGRAKGHHQVAVKGL